MAEKVARDALKKEGIIALATFCDLLFEFAETQLKSKVTYVTTHSLKTRALHELECRGGFRWLICCDICRCGGRFAHSDTHVVICLCNALRVDLFG
jgi:hypothetical protein